MHTCWIRGCIFIIIAGFPETLKAALWPTLEELHETTSEWLVTRTIAVDQSFAREDVRPTPTPQYRVIALGNIRLRPNESAELYPSGSLRMDVDLPNISRRLRLVLSTEDPSDFPGTLTEEGSNRLRLGASARLLPSLRLSGGLRARVPPAAYVAKTWSHPIQWNEWTFVPRQRFFWESDRGLGEITSLLASRWWGDIVLRPSVSLRWTERDRESDRELRDEGWRYGKGWRWQQTIFIGRAIELIHEEDYKTIVQGRDFAHGYGVTLKTGGDIYQTTESGFELLYRFPIQPRFLFGIMAAETNWKRRFDWQPEYILRIGFDCLFPGRHAYRAKR